VKADIEKSNSVIHKELFKDVKYDEE